MENFKILPVRFMKKNIEQIKIKLEELGKNIVEFSEAVQKVQI